MKHIGYYYLLTKMIYTRNDYTPQEVLNKIKNNHS